MTGEPRWRRVTGVALGVLAGTFLVSLDVVNGLDAGANGRVAHLTSLGGAAAKIATSGRPAGQDQIALARDVATAQPLAAWPYYVIGASLPLARGAQARQLIRLAVERDPRLLPAIGWQAADQLRSNQMDAAMRSLVRLANLKAHQSELASLMTLVAQMTADPVARVVLKRELAGNPEWRRDYLTALSASDVDRSIVFEMYGIVGAGLSDANESSVKPEDRAVFLRYLLARKEYDRAYLAWLLWLAPSDRNVVGNVFDGAFSGAAGLSPFAWDLVGEGGGGGLSIDGASGLSIDYSSSAGGDLAVQTLLLRPGRYRLGTQASFKPVPTDPDGLPLLWRLECVPETKPLVEINVPAHVQATRATSAPFEVPADGCRAQTLSLVARPGDVASRINGSIRSVAIEAAP